jgi:hypothetical protein
MVTLWLLRDGRSAKAFLAALAAWGGELDRLVREDRGGQDIEVVVRYIFRVAGEEPFELVRQRVAESAANLEEPMATIEEQLIQKGVQRGLEQGRTEALRSAVRRLLQAKFGALDADVERRVEEAALDELDIWIERIVTAERIEDALDH